MTGKRGGDVWGDRLTPRQGLFAKLVAETGSLSEAYRLAYNTENCKPASVNSMASRLAAKPKVAAQIRFHENEYIKERSLDVAQQREIIRDNLLQMGTDPSVSPSARVAALVALGKAVGFFTPEKTETPAFATHREAQEALARALNRLSQVPEILHLLPAQRLPRGAS